MNAPARIVSPGKVAIKRAIAAGRSAGLDVAGFDVLPDGTIRVFEARGNPLAPTSLFDQFEREGRL